MKRKYLLSLLVVLTLFIFTGCEKKKEEPKPTEENKTKLVENTDYKVNGEYTGTFFDVKKRGYYIDTLNEPNAPYYYIICMGEKSTGGYSLKVKEVNKIDDKTEIIIEEITPGENDTVTEAFTYSTIIVEFPKYQENLVIKNTKGEEFSPLNDY